MAGFLKFVVAFAQSHHIANDLTFSPEILRRPGVNYSMLLHTKFHPCLTRQPC